MRSSTLRSDPSSFIPWLAVSFGVVMATTGFTCPGPDPSSPTDDGAGGSGGTGGTSTTDTTATTTSQGGAGGTGGGAPCSPDLSTDILNCGQCGRACGTQGILNVSCNAGVCDSTCAPGHLNLAKPAAPALDDGCEAIEHRVFVTVTGYTPTWGGALGADVFCQNDADANGLGGTWMAWVSDATTSPSQRFVQDGGPYKRIDGPLIASDWADLTDGLLDVAISTTETMQANSDFAVWTGTLIDGTTTSIGDNCSQWTSSGAGSALFGYASNTNNFWTDTGGTQGCDVPFHLYCFEQQ